MAAMTRPAAGIQWLVAGAATGVATAVGSWLDGRMSTAGLAMVYLVAVAVAALWLDRLPAAGTSLMCVSALNFFFVPPRYTLEVQGPEYWWTLAVLLGLSLALGGLIGSLRADRARAELGRQRATDLFELSAALAQVQGHKAIAREGAKWVAAALERPCAVFLQSSTDSLHCIASAPEGDFHERSARWAMENGRMLGRGCDDWPDLPLWCAPFAPHDAGGAVQILLDPATPRPDPEALRHWQGLARQVALAVERERAAEAAHDATEAARHESARNTVLASLSHDLRTPLAGIVGSASTLRAQFDSLGVAQRKRLLANLENEARDITLMADNILQMARLSQPEWRLRRQWESLDDILSAAVERMRRRWPQARIQLKVAPGLPPIEAEAQLLAQVVANLVDNGLRQQGESGAVAVQAGRSRDGVFVAVRDHGPGLPDGAAERLFDMPRAERADGRPGAAGLGLAICRLVVQAHGGRIAAHTCDPGTEVRFDLPAAPLLETA